MKWYIIKREFKKYYVMSMLYTSETTTKMNKTVPENTYTNPSTPIQVILYKYDNYKYFPFLLTKL